eukprot:30986-Pelagococcus_subviridis.AAC.9
MSDAPNIPGARVIIPRAVPTHDGDAVGQVVRQRADEAVVRPVVLLAVATGAALAVAADVAVLVHRPRRVAGRRERDPPRDLLLVKLLGCVARGPLDVAVVRARPLRRRVFAVLLRVRAFVFQTRDDGLRDSAPFSTRLVGALRPRLGVSSSFPRLRRIFFRVVLVLALGLRLRRRVLPHDRGFRPGQLQHRGEPA